MTENHKVLIELENTGCYKCPFLQSSDIGEDCVILRKGVQEGQWSNINFRFDESQNENWRYKNCPLFHDGYLCRFCGIKVIMND